MTDVLSKTHRVQRPLTSCDQARREFQPVTEEAKYITLTKLSLSQMSEAVSWLYGIDYIWIRKSKPR